MEKLASGYGLIEGPVWDADRGLIFSDVIFGGAFALKEDGAVEQVIAHRKGMGGMAPHKDGGLVVSGRNISHKAFGAEGSTSLLDADGDLGVIGFNDLTTDHKGRIYVGGLTFRPVGSTEEPTPGPLYCIDTDGSARVVGQDVMLTNGLGFSPDGKRLYHSESRRNLVRVYEVADNGDLSPHQTFANVEDGVPDGLAVADDGSVWVAVAHGSRVDVFEADGSLRRLIPVSLPMVTSVCFGGDDLDDLYIVTGSGGTDNDRAGSIFRVSTEVTGLPITPAVQPLS
jgi:gluconolactonase